MLAGAHHAVHRACFPPSIVPPDTLTEDFKQSAVERQLDPTLPNLATCLKAAGYAVVYKGKWHLSKRVKAADGTPLQDDISRYGFDGWDAPDAGATPRWRTSAAARPTTTAAFSTTRSSFSRSTGIIPGPNRLSDRLAGQST